EVDEDPAVVVRVLLHPGIEGLDLLLVEESQDSLLELPAALARDYLDEGRLLGHRFLDDLLQGSVDLLAAVVDVVQIELELHRMAWRRPPAMSETTTADTAISSNTVANQPTCITCWPRKPPRMLPHRPAS